MTRNSRRIAKKYEAKRQHYVSKGYLEAWHDQNKLPREYPYVWVYSRTDKDEWDGGKKKSPKKLFRESNFYTKYSGLQPEERDISLELLLGKIESDFCKVRRDILTHHLPIENDTREVLAAFIASTQWRTPGSKEHIRSQWQPVLDRLKSMQSAMSDMTPSEINKLSTGIGTSSKGNYITETDVEEIVREPLQTTLPSYIAQLAPRLCNLNMSILYTARSPGFITSDEPCLWFDPEAYKRPPMYRSPALMYESVEITLPLSPNLMALISHHDFPEYFDLDNADFLDKALNDLNRRTCCHSRKSIIVNRQEFRKIWTDRGKKPHESPE